MKYIQNIILACAVLAAASACSKDVDDALSGTVRLGVESESVTGVEAKAASSEGVDDFSVRIVRTGTSETVLDDVFSNVKGKEYNFRVGDYYAEAFNVSEADALAQNGGYGGPRYYGRQDFALGASSVTVTVGCVPVNARVRISLDSSFTDMYELSSTTVTLAQNADYTERPLLMVSSGTAAASEAYFTAGTKVYVKIQTKRPGASSVQNFTAAVLTVSAGISHEVTVSLSSSFEGAGITFTINNVDSVTNDFLSLESYTPGTVTED
ncbi:MAG: DUF4493 domain-containing protein [Candidatus Cryptobacteroides sp.]